MVYVNPLLRRTVEIWAEELRTREIPSSVKGIKNTEPELFDTNQPETSEPPKIKASKPLSPSEKELQKAQLELIHQQTREARARAEIAERELFEKLKWIDKFKKENQEY